MKAVGLIAIVFFCFATKTSFGQNKSDSALFEEQYQKAVDYIDADLYGEGASELDKAIDFAAEKHLDKAYLNAQITKAELKRKTHEFMDGLAILKKLSGTIQYPRVHVRKLGRLAAIFHEQWFPDSFHREDTVRKYLNEALAMAKHNHFTLLEGELLNELGYLESDGNNREFGRECLQRAADIFESLGELRAYANTLDHLMRYSHFNETPEKTDSLANILVPLLEKNEWHEVGISAYNNLIVINQMRGNKEQVYEWKLKAASAYLNFERKRQSEKLAVYEVLQETEKLKSAAVLAEKVAKQQANDLETQKSRTKSLIIFITILSILVIGILFMFIREHRIKQKMDTMNKQLQVANERYHMLMVESNHRIKNNLQMIISMLEYASMDDTNPGALTLRKMSSKIHAISALHKHLYSDIHNEKVNLHNYFLDIISHYSDMMSDSIEVNGKIAPAQIQSERIVYFGLILNEMLSNTLEHCKNSAKKARISVKSIANGFEYQYCDNSTHVQHDNIGQGHGLIQQLINRIEGFQYVFNSENGEYKFKFHA